MFWNDVLRLSCQFGHLNPKGIARNPLNNAAYLYTAREVKEVSRGTGIAKEREMCAGVVVGYGYGYGYGYVREGCGLLIIDFSSPLLDYCGSRGPRHVEGVLAKEGL